MTVEIRDAVLGDARAVGELITELGYPTTSEAMRDRLAMILSDPSGATFVARRRWQRCRRGWGSVGPVS